MRPRLLIIAALVVAVGFSLLHLLGGRDAVTVLSGTLPADGQSVPLGLAYASSWFALVLLAPILVIAGGLQAIAERCRRERGRRSARPVD